jgi:hypothetical protein
VPQRNGSLIDLLASAVNGKLMAAPIGVNQQCPIGCRPCPGPSTPRASVNLSTGCLPIVHNHSGCPGLAHDAATTVRPPAARCCYYAMPVLVVGAVAAFVGSAQFGPVRVIDSAGAPPDTLI